MSEVTQYVVRNWGSSKCHVAAVPEWLLRNFKFMGSEGQAVGAPITARCATTLNREPIVVMTKARVDCRPCARLSGVASVGIDA